MTCGIGVGDVLAEHADALVARHLLVQREPDRLAERDGLGALGVGSRVGAAIVDDRRRPDHVVERPIAGSGRGAASAASAAARTVSLRFGAHLLDRLRR